MGALFWETIFENARLSVSHCIKSRNMNLFMCLCFSIFIPSTTPPAFSKKCIDLFKSSWQVGRIMLWWQTWKALPVYTTQQCGSMHVFLLDPHFPNFFKGISIFQWLFFFPCPLGSEIMCPQNVNNSCFYSICIYMLSTQK